MKGELCTKAQLIFSTLIRKVGSVHGDTGKSIQLK